MEKEEQRFVVKFLSLKGWESKRIHQALINTLGDDPYGLSQIKIWLQRFRTEDLSCGDLPRAGRPPLTLRPQVDAFLHKYPFISTRIIAKYFLTTASTVKDIHLRELGTRKFSRRWVPHSLSDAQKVGRVEAAKNVKDLQESETNDLMASQQARSPGFNTPQHPRKCLPVRQAVNAKNSDDGVLYRKEPCCVRCSSKMWHIQSAIFHR
jgi:hypothetical protein